MSNVWQLIERLDGSGDLQQFARAAERFGDDLERCWREHEDGVDLLWFAAAVRVDHRLLIAAASTLFAGVVARVEIVDQEASNVLEAVCAWERGEGLLKK